MHDASETVRTNDIEAQSLHARRLALSQHTYEDFLMLSIRLFLTRRRYSRIEGMPKKSVDTVHRSFAQL